MLDKVRSCWPGLDVDLGMVMLYLRIAGESLMVEGQKELDDRIYVWVLDGSGEAEIKNGI